jgi:predicted signal transduction protein with EAL and GGDEF domain
MDASNSNLATNTPRRKSPSLEFIDQFLKSGSHGKLTGLLVGQLDAFNRIGSTFGADQSDAFCADYAQQLRSMLPANTPIIRLSERRIAILLSIDSMTTLLDVASRFIEDQPPQYQAEEDTLLVDITFGISVYPTHAHDGASLFRRAELALNEACARELTFEIYRPDATQQQAALWKFSSDLEKAVQKKDPIKLYMQPKIRVADGVAVGAEALVRWRQENGQLILPSEFIGLAERSGSIVPMTWLVFDKIVETVASWGFEISHFSIAVNVTAQVLDHVEFKSKLIALKRGGPGKSDSAISGFQA